MQNFCSLPQQFSRSMSSSLLSMCLILPTFCIAQHRLPATATASATTNSLILHGADKSSVVISAAEFQAMQQETLTVYNEHTQQMETYTGVLLSDLLTRIDAPTGKMLRGKSMLDYLVAEGSDHYKIVIALADVDPNFHKGDVIVADAMAGKPLTQDGPFKLIIAGDKRPARWVRNLVSVSMESAE